MPSLSPEIHVSTGVDADAESIDEIVPDTSATAIPLPEMIKIPGGTFTMGCTEIQLDKEGKELPNDCYDREKPAHPVTLRF